MLGAKKVLKGLPILSLSFEPKAREGQPVSNLLLCLPVSSGLVLHLQMVEGSEEEELVTVFVVLRMSSALQAFWAGAVPQSCPKPFLAL